MFIIIKTINLSYPKKIIMDKINNTVFESKLKDIKLNRNHRIISYTIGIIFFSQQLAYAGTSVEKSTKIIEFLNNFGPPLILTACELFKLSMPIKIHKKNFDIL